jgi:hydroxymethylpyrimidine pyrophosphatase-like HAD family hydrolase
MGENVRRDDAARRSRTAYRLLALDMDGTLLDDRQRISDTNAAWIRRAIEAGIIVCLSTGRSFESAVPYAEQLGLETPMITVNGGEVWSKPYELHRRICLPAETVQRLYETARAYGDVWFWAYATDGLYNKERWTSDAAGKMWLKFGFHTGLMEVCRLVGCSLAETVAVGDSLNDLAAIRAAGLGVAMGNAQEAVKAAADAVTGTNEEDGVAQVIRDYLLKDV